MGFTLLACAVPFLRPWLDGIDHGDLTAFGSGCMLIAGAAGIAIGRILIDRFHVFGDEHHLMLGLAMLAAGSGDIAYELAHIAELHGWLQQQGVGGGTFLAGRVILALGIIAAVGPPDRRWPSLTLAAEHSRAAVLAIALGATIGLGSQVADFSPRWAVLVVAGALAATSGVAVTSHLAGGLRPDGSLAGAALLMSTGLTTLAFGQMQEGVAAEWAQVLIALGYLAPIVGLGLYQTRGLKDSHEARLEAEAQALHLDGINSQLAREFEGLSELERRVRAFVEHGSVPLVSFDSSRRVEFANRAAESVFGAAADGLVGLHFTDLLTGDHSDLVPDDTEPFTALVQVVARRPDGSHFPAEVSATAALVRGRHNTTWLIRDLTEQRTFEAALSRQATTDPLTGYGNRKALLGRLEAALAARSPDRTVALLFVDLDRFKTVNDRLGHDAGDLLLISAAQRIDRAIRATDTLTRLGGDEFVVVCTDVADVAEVIPVAERIIASIGQRFDLAGRDAFLAASIGIAVADEALTPGQLLDQADTALYRAKERGRARWELFDQRLAAQAAARRQVELDLVACLENDELDLVFQPIVDINTGRPLGLEALLRWNRPGGEVLAPAHFVPAAESAGIIVPIGLWVLRNAASQLSRWKQRWPNADLYVSVNVSSRQLLEPTATASMVAAVKTSGIDPSLVMLELTESMLVADTEAARVVLRELREAGFRIAIDDFGTGYSSMTYLRTFPIDVVKIDRSFVTPLCRSGSDATIVASISALAGALGRTVIAEGVEDFSTAGSLLALRCGTGQGYYWSAPQSGEEITEWLAARLNVSTAAG